MVKLFGQSECEIEVRENWGLKVVVKDKAGNDHVVWGMELERCSKNPHKRDDPFESERLHAYNRAQLKSMSEGTVVSYPCGNEYQQTKVMRVVRAGCFQRVRYTVPLSRCIHEQSVKVTKKLIESARKDNRLWGAGIRPPPPRITERHVITPETYDNLRDWIFSTDFLEPLKASEQSTQRGHCFAVKEAANTTYPRYVEHADEAKVDPVSERVYRWFCMYMK